jgi:DNA polymerase-3 subunit beta
MKIIVNKALLGEAANLLARVINPKNVLPILADVLFDVKDNEVTLTASDTEVTLSTTIALDTMEGDGRFCVSAKDLSAALAEITDEKVTIIATLESDMRFTLQHNSGETYFPIDNADEYPLPKQEQVSEPVTLPGLKVRDALKRSLWATASDDLRPIMNGVCFALKDSWLDIVTSDGHVLVKSHIDTSNGTKMTDEFRFIVPKKAATLLSGVLSGDPVSVSWNEHSCRMEFFPYTLTMRLVEGKYPNYNSIIPASQPLEAIVPRAFALCSLKKVLPFSADTQGSHLLRLSLTKDRLKLTAEDFDFSKGSHDSFYVDYNDRDIEVGVSGSRLAAVLSKMNGGELVFGLSDPSHAITFEPKEQSEGCDVLMLTMPMLLNED